ncbi:MAG: TonB family protein [Candidatus Mycalebacterium zealandia]|nr:MAG: TonB family protein [Candidatus Mycalebacterium zealandia]
MGLQPLFVAVQVEEKDDLLLEITDYVPPTDDPDTVVEKPKAYSTKSYNSREDKVKYGTYGTPTPPTPAPVSKETKESEGDATEYVKHDTLTVDDSSVKQLIKAVAEKERRKIYNQYEDRRIGNDGDYRGDSDVNDFSVLSPTDKYISYIQKFRSRVQNVWRPRRVSFGGPEISSDIYTVLRVEIRKDGKLEFVEISRSSGIAAFDLEAVRTVRDAAPYSPFPASWKGESTFAFTFGFKIVDNL